MSLVISLFIFFNQLAAALNVFTLSAIAVIGLPIVDISFGKDVIKSFFVKLNANLK